MQLTSRESQRARLARFGPRVQWVSALPARLDGVVVGNEVLDAMPVTLLHWDGQAWFERGVTLPDPASLAEGYTVYYDSWW